MRGELGGSLEHHRGGGRGAAQVYARVYPRVFLKVFLQFTLEFSPSYPRVYPRTSQSRRTWGCSRLRFLFCIHGAVRHSQCNAVRKEARVKKPKHVSRKRPTYPVCGLCF